MVIPRMIKMSSRLGSGPQDDVTDKQRWVVISRMIELSGRRG